MEIRRDLMEHLSMWLAAEEDGYEEFRLYQKGGLCPVHLGDRLDNCTYTVVHKLGVGGTATVWLARDNLYKPKSKDHPYQYVALKILLADMYPYSQEPAILQQLHEASSASANSKDVGPTESVTCDTISPNLEPFRSSIIRILHEFSHESPNGIHQVLVMPVTRPLRELERRLSEDVSEPYFEIARQLSGVIAFLHQNGVTHGDIRIENCGYLCEELTDEHVREIDEPEIHPVALWRYPDEKVSMPASTRFDHVGRCPKFFGDLPSNIADGMPKYVVSPATWQNSHTTDVFASFRRKPRICLLDFGFAFSTNAPSSKLLPISTPACYVAPEYQFATHELSFSKPQLSIRYRGQRHHGDARAELGDVGYQVDVWSLGCLMYELLLGTDFMGYFKTEYEETLLQVDPVIPKDWEKLPATKVASKNVGPDLRQASDDFWAKRFDGLCRVRCEDVQKQKREGAATPPSKSEDFQKLIEFLRYVLRLDPRQRPRAIDVLERLSSQ